MLYVQNIKVIQVMATKSNNEHMLFQLNFYFVPVVTPTTNNTSTAISMVLPLKTIDQIKQNIVSLLQSPFRANGCFVRCCLLCHVVHAILWIEQNAKQVFESHFMPTQIKCSSQHTFDNLLRTNKYTQQCVC